MQSKDLTPHVSAHMTPLQETLLQIFVPGAIVSAGVAFIAGRARGWAVPLVLCGLSVLIFWVTFFLGLDLGYRAWQSMPDPPDAAYSDASPSGVLIAGWVPGGIYASFWYGLSWLVRLFVWKPRVLQAELVTDALEEGIGPRAVETGNAYQTPGS